MTIIYDPCLYPSTVEWVKSQLDDDQQRQIQEGEWGVFYSCPEDEHEDGYYDFYQFDCVEYDMPKFVIVEAWQDRLDIDDLRKQEVATNN